MIEDGSENDIDALIRRVDPDRWLTSRFIADKRARADVLALYAFDHELARALKAASTSLLVEIRLTWWREALDEIFAGGAVRRHPVVEALAAAVRRSDLPRAPLEAMIDGRIEALELEFDAASALAWADTVEGSAATLAARIIDPDANAQAVAPAGRSWGLVLLRRAGRAPGALIDPMLTAALSDARLSAKALSVAALPAALPARLARFDLAHRSPSALGKQIALIVATATGRV